MRRRFPLAAVLASWTALLGACGSEPSTDSGGKAAAAAVADWPVYGGNAAGTRYSPLTEIRRENVTRLTVAWTLHTGDVADARNSKKATFEATPILVDGTLYFPTPRGRVFAVDPESGEVRWRFDTKLDLSVDYAEPTSRGVAAWRDPERDGDAACGRRLVQGPLLSPFGVPCNPPPWGTLAAVDLTTGEVRWQSTLGTPRDILPLTLTLAFGTPNLGGPMVTAAGLVFIGAAMDNYLRAFEVETGAELWKGRLPAGGQATPMTYRLRPDGRQYVVIAAGGHGRLGTKLGDALVAFALPLPKP